MLPASCKSGRYRPRVDVSLRFCTAKPSLLSMKQKRKLETAAIGYICQGCVSQPQATTHCFGLVTVLTMCCAALSSKTCQESIRKVFEKAVETVGQDWRRGLTLHSQVRVCFCGSGMLQLAEVPSRSGICISTLRTLCERFTGMLLLREYFCSSVSQCH